MRVFLGVVSRRPDQVSVNRFAEAAIRALPFKTGDGAPGEQWADETKRVVLAAWSNEPAESDRPLLTVHPDGAVGFSGYVHGQAAAPPELMTGPAPRLGGVWSLFGCSSLGITALTCASGAEVVFYAETPELVVVGNRALLVHLVANPTGPEADLIGLAGVLNAGYCVTARTAFEGVRALGPAERMHCDSAGRITVEPYQRDTTPTTATDVADALVASVAPLRTIDHPVRLGLTGGRDSRLLVALLTTAGVPVNTYTSGLPDDPDVVVAQEVAARLGIAHKVTPPQGAKINDATVTVDVRSRLREAAVLSEGMLSAYDRVGRIDGSYNAHTVPFGGNGGEILRGYYAGAVGELGDPAAAERYMRGRIYPAARRMAASARATYEMDTQAWMSAAREAGAASLEDFYVRQRTGRWTGAARASANIGSLARRPYLDHLVVDAVRRIPLAERTSERLIADLIDVLAPSLKDVRFAGQRWKFDKTPPADPAERAEWERRAPVQSAHGDQAGFNWRLDLPEVRAELAAVIQAAPPAFWALADQRKVLEFLTPLDGRTRADTVKMWHLASVADALTHDFYATPAKFDTRASEVVANMPTRDGMRLLPGLEATSRRIARRIRDRLRG